MPSSKKKKQGSTTDSPQASTSRDVTGVTGKDVSVEFGTRANSRFNALENEDEMYTTSFVTEDKIQDMFANLQAGLLLTLRDELDKRDRKRSGSRSGTSSGGEENAGSDEERRSSASRKSTLSNSKIVQTIYDAIPKYDGDGDVQKLLDFADKVEDYVNIVEMTPTLMVTIITTKLTGTASLLWRHHKKNFEVSSPLRVKDWKGLRELLFRSKITEEHERHVLVQLDVCSKRDP